MSDDSGRKPTPSAAARRVYDRVNDITNVMLDVQNLAAAAVRCADAGDTRQAVDLWTRARARLRTLGPQRAFGSCELLDLAELQLDEAIDTGS